MAKIPRPKFFTQTIPKELILGATCLGLMGTALLATALPAVSISPESHVCYVILALVVSAMRVMSSDTPGNTSMGFLFVLVSLIELSTLHSLLIGSLAILIVAPIQARKSDRLLLTMTDLLTTGLGILAGTGDGQP